jgi:hypothetical protein
MIKKKDFGITLEENRTGNNAAFHHSHGLFTGGFFVFPVRLFRLCGAIFPEDLQGRGGIKDRHGA